MKHGNPDTTQEAIVNALRSVGVTVCIITGVGDGAPDLLCGRSGRTELLEVKTAKEKLRPVQEEWHRSWRGKPVHVVRTVEEAFAALGFEVVRAGAPR